MQAHRFIIIPNYELVSLTMSVADNNYYLLKEWV